MPYDATSVEAAEGPTRLPDGVKLTMLHDGSAAVAVPYEPLVIDVIKDTGAQWANGYWIVPAARVERLERSLRRLTTLVGGTARRAQEAIDGTAERRRQFEAVLNTVAGCVARPSGVSITGDDRPEVRIAAERAGLAWCAAGQAWWGMPDLDAYPALIDAVRVRAAA